VNNDFTSQTRGLFSWNYECWICGRNTQDALHHILGRGHSSDLENSPLNACPICNFNCHIGNGKLTDFEIRIKLLEKTFIFLVKNNYQLSKKDYLFIEKYSNYYDRVFKNLFTASIATKQE
jgi:DNA-directed RNA polymerase subunit RPC12/RpoP